MDTSRYLDLFVQESTEHLEALGNDLLAMERDGSSSALDAAFRHAHSIKGMAGSMGYSPIADLAHALEDYLMFARERGEPVDPSGVDAALEATDGLGSLVRAAAAKSPLESAGVHVEEIIARLRSTGGADPSGTADRTEASGGGDTSGDAARPLPPDEKPAPQAESSSAAPKKGSSRPHLKVAVQVAGTSKVPAVRGFLVHKRVSGLGEIISSDPPLADLKAGNLPGGRLEIVLATDAGEEALSRELGTISELDAIDVETIAVPASESDAEIGARPLPPERATPSEPIRTVRVRTDLLDGFMDGVGEMLLATDRLRELGEEQEHDSVSPLGEAIERIGRIVKGLHRQVMATRMTPLSTVTDRLPRVLRETLRHVEKEATLVVEGADIEIDRAILDEIESPLGHIVRNCVGHGIELPDDRREAGKPAKGRIELTARRDRDRVVIEISDDGRGLDDEKLRGQALEAGLMDERSARALPRGEALMLACLPGLSTAESITEISGRGVGLDVVKETVESLGGLLEIESELDRGTLFRLALPLTVAIQRLLLVEAAGDVFAVPVSKVLQVQEVAAEGRTSSKGQPMVPFLDGLVRAFDLLDVLDLETHGDRPEPAPHVVVEGPSGHPVALAVDRLCGQIEGVVRPLGRPLDLLGGLSGVSMLPDGRPVLLLDLASLVRSAESVSGGGLRIV